MVWDPGANYSRGPDSAVDGILARLPKGCTGVLASTQYRMGFILTEQNEIVFRDDSLSHGVRKALAEEVNAIIKQNSVIRSMSGCDIREGYSVNLGDESLMWQGNCGVRERISAQGRVRSRGDLLLQISRGKS